MKVHWWTYNHCLFVSYLTSVAFGYGWISNTKFQKFSDKDWIWIFKKFIEYGQESKNQYPLISALYVAPTVFNVPLRWFALEKVYSQFRSLMQEMIQLDNRSRSRTKNPTPAPTPSVVRNPTPTPPKNLELLTTPGLTQQPC